MFDFHNHVLPEIDDGSPHIIADTHPNDTNSISSAYNSLKSHLESSGNNSLVGYAAEHMIDNMFCRELKTKKIFCMFQEKISFANSHMPANQIEVKTPLFNYK